MKIREFMNLKRVLDENNLGAYNDIEVGEKFLYGSKVIDQIERDLKEGDMITYYILLSKGQTVSMAPQYEKLEK